MRSKPAPLFENAFLSNKEPELVKAQRKPGTINVPKTNNSFRFIDEMIC